MSQRRTWTAGEVLAAAERVARERGADLSRADLLRLLAETLRVERLALLLDHERPLTGEERARFRERLVRLLEGEPFAYVVGHADFYGRRFAVDPRVLIPRSETESLVEAALERLEPRSVVFEPGTGSGCIACTLVLERPDLTVVASDVDPGALEVAKTNARRLGARVTFVEGSWWEPVQGRSFDALVANPPYVDRRCPDLVDPAVRRYEPALAVFADPPLSAYLALLEGGRAGLRTGAWVLLECGIDTAEPLLARVRRSVSYTEARLLPDLSGRARILVCRRR